MVATFGLTHVALSVRDPGRAFAFYEGVFGMVAVYRERDFIQAQTPGARDVLVLERGEFVPGEPYAFVRDVDGYTVEIWYEIPTAVDPEMVAGTAVRGETR